jgi:hypothetical protein
MAWKIKKEGIIDAVSSIAKQSQAQWSTQIEGSLLWKETSGFKEKRRRRFSEPIKIIKLKETERNQ